MRSIVSHKYHPRLSRHHKKKPQASPGASNFGKPEWIAKEKTYGLFESTFNRSSRFEISQAM